VRTLARATLAAAVLTYVLIVLGALVRATGSGLSCPDWPACYGYWVPTPSRIAALEVGYTYTQVMLEWVHRAIAGVLLGPLILAIGVMAVWMRRQRPGLAPLGLGIVVVLVVQALIGAVTVLDQNSPWSVALHLGTALVLLALILLLWERARGTRVAAEPLVPSLAALTWLATMGAMITAAVTAKSGATLACSTWPLCDGAVIPDLQAPGVAIHFAHRSLAAVTGLGILGLAITTRAQRPFALAALALVALQIGLGALVIVLIMPVWIAVTHQALGVLLFALVSLLLWRALSAGPREPSRVRLRTA
jgi:heme a synthase